MGKLTFGATGKLEIDYSEKLHQIRFFVRPN